jgi:hypothetical protein
MQDAALLGHGKILDQVAEVARLGESLTMRVIRAHHDRGGLPEVGDDLHDVVLRVGHHANVLFEDGARTALQGSARPFAAAAHAAALVHLTGKERHPLGAEFRHHDMDVGEAAEQIVEDQRRERLFDRTPAPAVLPLPRGHLEEDRLGVHSPCWGDVFVVPELTDVVGHAGAGLVDPRPERIEVGVGRRAPVGGSGVEHDELRAAVEHELQLCDGRVEIA